MHLLSRLRRRTAEAVTTNGTDYHLIVGLGNPGPEYARHRHNVGFQCLDRLAEARGLSFDHLQHKARVAGGTIATADVILAKPLNFMNLSGPPVRSLVRHYRVPLSRLLVIYDDLDIPLGTIRLRPRGGSGGHLGVTSIIESLGSRDFPRLRVGIGRPPPGVDPTDHVLSDFTPDERPVIEEVYERVMAAVTCLLAEGIEVAMSRYNSGP